MTTPVVPSQVTFSKPLLGLGAFTAFECVPLDESGVLYRLSADGGPQLIAVSAQAYFPSYAPEFSDHALQAIELTEPRDALTLALVTVGSSLEEHTVNLLAPIVVNPSTGSAFQVVLDDDVYPMRASLV
ncbi:flagellar assembly protein FliW [Timonella sp. A28]|uniref:flagellar assembly protein FliW n=1 Tax=Timonella sp. A28 TaxID=3442640 RepID=UPI003EB97D5B